MHLYINVFYDLLDLSKGLQKWREQGPALCSYCDVDSMDKGEQLLLQTSSGQFSKCKNEFFTATKLYPDFSHKRCL